MAEMVMALALGVSKCRFESYYSDIKIHLDMREWLSYLLWKQENASSSLAI